MAERGRGAPRARRTVVGAIAGAAGGTLLAGACAKQPPPPPPKTRVPLAGLALGARTVVKLGEEPVEVLRTEAGVRARSLRCSHFGCLVNWRPAENDYLCTCHQGRFDADGGPIGGPPYTPLRTVPAVVEGDTIVVG